MHGRGRRARQQALAIPADAILARPLGLASVLACIEQVLNGQPALRGLTEASAAGRVGRRVSWRGGMSVPAAAANPTVFAWGDRLGGAPTEGAAWMNTTLVLILSLLAAGGVATMLLRLRVRRQRVSLSEVVILSVAAAVIVMALGAITLALMRDP